MSFDLLGFVLNVLAGLVTTAILVSIGFFASRHFRDAFAFAIRKVLDLELEEAYANRDSAKEFVKQEIARASFVRLFSSRFTDYQGGTEFSNLFREIASRNLQVQILMPDPAPSCQLFDWTAYRNQECRKFESTMVPGRLASQMKDALSHFASAPASPNLQVAITNVPHLCRLVLTDKCAFFTPYTDDRHGDENRVLKFLAGTAMYAWLSRVFNHMWDSAVWYREHPVDRCPELLPHWDDVEALIFDCDGTLADSMSLHYEALKSVLDEVGVTLAREQFFARGGMPTREIIREIFAENGRPCDETELRLLAAKKEEQFMATISKLKPIQWVVDVAKKNRGLRKLAVASGATREVLCKQLEQLGIADLFDLLVAAEDVQDAKPAPDSFLVAAERLAVRPEKCVVYEDSDHGIVAAKRARMRWIDIRGMAAANSFAP